MNENVLNPSISLRKINLSLTPGDILPDNSPSHIVVAGDSVTEGLVHAWISERRHARRAGIPFEFTVSIEMGNGQETERHIVRGVSLVPYPGEHNNFRLDFKKRLPKRCILRKLVESAE